MNSRTVARTSPKHKVSPKLFLLAPATALALWGCKVGPNYEPPKMEMPSQYSEINSATRPTTRSATQPGYDTTQPQPKPATDQALEYERWWESFNDPMLNSLIERAANQNLDVATAISQIEQARAQRGVTAAGFFPSVNAVGSYTNSFTGPGAAGNRSINTGSGVVPTGSSGSTSNFWQAGFDASWEIDLFGGTARGVEAADANIQAQIANKRNVMLSTLAEVAVDYLDLRTSQQRLAVAKEQLKSQQDTLVLTRSKADAGLVPNLDVAQQEATAATTASAMPPLETEIRQDIHALSVLLGEDPGALSAELTPQKEIPMGPPAVPPGLPSELLRRRPDIQQAERQLAAATANIGVATANLFPQISIDGTLGTEAQKFGQLFNWSSRYYTIGPSVVWNVFDAGQTQYQIQVETALQAQALIAYKKTVLTALMDVDNALVAYNREQVRQGALKESVDANQQAYELSKELFEKGSKDFLSVLVAEESLATAKDLALQSQQSMQEDLVALYKALGGGWQTFEPGRSSSKSK